MAAFGTFCWGIVLSVRRALCTPARQEATALTVAVLVWLLGGLVDNQVADRYLYVVPALLIAFARLPESRAGAIVGTPAPTPAVPAAIPTVAVADFARVAPQRATPALRRSGVAR